MGDKYSRSETRDNRCFNFGEVWQAKDKQVRLLPTDRIKYDRNFHEFRPVVIVQNCLENADEDYTTILVAPLSHRIEFEQAFDVVLFPATEEEQNDGVKEKCMVQIYLTQPIMKVDLEKRLCEISDDKKTEIIATMQTMFGIPND